MSNKPSIERDFDDFLNGEDHEIARIYRKLPPAEPDARLDAAVLALARDAVEPQRRAAIRHARAQHRLPAWMIGVGSAAGIVFAAGLAWQLRNSINAPPAAMRPADSSADVISVTILPPREPKGVPSPPLPEVAAKPAPPPAAPAPPAAAAPKLERADAQAAAAGRSEAQGVTEYTLPSGAAGRRPQPAPFVRDEAKAQDAFAGNAPAADGELDQIAVTGSRIQQKSADDKKSDTYEPEEQPGYRGAPRHEELSRRRELAAAAKEKRTVDARAAAGAATPAPVQAAPVQAAPAQAAPARSVPAEKDRLMPVNSAALQRNAKLPPAKWLEKIQQLVKEDKHDEAVDNAQYFRAKYPGYPLPDAIRQLADEER